MLGGAVLLGPLLDFADQQAELHRACSRADCFSKEKGKSRGPFFSDNPDRTRESCVSFAKLHVQASITPAILDMLSSVATENHMSSDTQTDVPYYCGFLT
jgi:hypothetical protein